MLYLINKPHVNGGGLGYAHSFQRIFAQEREHLETLLFLFHVKVLSH